MQKVSRFFHLLVRTRTEALTRNNIMEIEKHTTNEEFHLGKLIKIELTRQGRSITWLACQINCSRENLYQLFRNPWIHTETLFKIGKALDVDFFKCCSDYQNAQKQEEKLTHFR